MKQLKELNFSDLSTEQKIGLVTVSSVRKKEDFEFTLEMIKKRAVGAVWIYPYSDYNHEESMKAMREAADYPLIFIADAEAGMGEHTIGRQNALGIANSEELAYAFGKITAIEARRCGINVVCNPILDMADGNCACGTNIRSLGNDKERVAKIAAAEAQGMHDGGVLTVGKHYPGSGTEEYIDSHMAETGSDATLEELLNYNLYPYKYLIDRGLLDGVMTRHTRFYKIDDYYPASLSKKVISIIREKLGFDGFCVTDALPMMGIVARFGTEKSKGMSIAAGNDLALVFGNPRREYDIMKKCYAEGIFTDEELDRAVKVVLNTQHKIMSLNCNAQISAEDEANFRRINTDSIYERCCDGVDPSISKDGKHLFAILTDLDVNCDALGKIAVDTITNHWYKPEKIMEMLDRKFPQSRTYAIKEYPSRLDVARFLDTTTKYDDVIFVTYFNSAPYLGREMLSARIISIFDALQKTNRISTVIHFGNPYVLEDIAHVSRIIIGPASECAGEAAINVLAGDYPAMGIMTYDVKFK